MTDRKAPEELGADELDSISGGIAGSAQPNAGSKRKKDMKGVASTASGTPDGFVEQSAGGNSI